MGKKVILIDARKGSDFTLDAVWAGLVRYHGPENVIDWPALEKHREGVPHLTGDVEKDYGAERRTLSYTGLEIPKYSFDQISSMFVDGQISMIFVDEREESWKLYRELRAHLFDVPVVVIAGHDKFWNAHADHPMNILRPYYGKNLKALFADNWRATYDLDPMIRPMSYALNFDHLWSHAQSQMYRENKIYDICFIGYNSDPRRYETVKLVADRYSMKNNYLFIEQRPNVMTDFLPKKEYFRIMAQSKICLNLNGAAECGKALRFYEIPYVGSYMLSQRDRAKQVMPFIGGFHCDYFDDENSLFKMIDRALDNPRQRERIAEAGHAHAIINHSALARVEYIYREIKNIEERL